MVKLPPNKSMQSDATESRRRYGALSAIVMELKGKW
jgi:hypothetical protein